MKKIFLLLLLSIFLITGCNNKDKEQGAILFSSKPIDQYFTFDKAETNFYTGQKINFVVLNPKPFTSDTLRLQIIRNNMKSKVFMDLVHARDIEIDKTKFYAINSFCVYQDGRHIVRIFSPDNIDTPLAEGIINISEP